MVRPAHSTGFLGRVSGTGQVRLQSRSWFFETGGDFLTFRKATHFRSLPRASMGVYQEHQRSLHLSFLGLLRNGHGFSEGRLSRTRDQRSQFKASFRESSSACLNSGLVNPDLLPDHGVPELSSSDMDASNAVSPEAPCFYSCVDLYVFFYVHATFSFLLSMVPCYLTSLLCRACRCQGCWLCHCEFFLGCSFLL